MATASRNHRSRTGRTILAMLGLVMLLPAGCANPTSSPVADQPVTTSLAIPELAQSTVVDGERTFHLTAQQAQTDFGPAAGAPTATYGLNRSYLGPTLRMRQGEDVAVEVTNKLAEATTLHWHGMHVPARMDGGPHQMIAPGASWTARWQVDQPQATLWYHAHPHGATAPHVYRGLAGMILVDPAAGSPQSGLPDEYGVDDIPVIVQDKSFDADGQLVFQQKGPSSTGFLGDTIMVNGTIGAYLDVTSATTRLRLLNASTARIYQFGFSDNRGFAVVASDGGLLPRPVTTNRIQLSPGERAEIVVTMVPGESVMLGSYSPDFGARVAADNRFGTGDFNVLQLRAAAQLRPGVSVPAELADLPTPDPGTASNTRRFTINSQIINRRPMALGRIDEVVPLGATEIWELANRDPQPHNFHIHDTQFRVLDVDGRAPDEVFAGWKDTVYLPPGETVRILATFSDYADPTWPYMYHCHLLYHEDSGLMGQFVVVEPGQQVVPPAVPPGSGHDQEHASDAPDRL